MTKSIVLKSSVFISTLFFSLSSLAAEGDKNLAKEAFGQLKTDAEQYTEYAWPLVILVTGSLIGIKLFKKYANRSS
ncbi:major coat protein [Providencia hangzhouensis]|uniref:Phage major coat protein, Gp8 n=1 Tax=Providencia rettgeri TaxID=587 RepID=A0A9N8D0I0_PRORE|nr:major coat protein [Providencia rettgeri]CAB5681964.1 Phage major coat protein, Gp8 [Providencia rettgeri]CAB5708965.1 Phage major coat protein, Gp8 [Providencia rettgeri]CAC9240826.1 Phage major coat protein, Gp8 [Providencia rettgeri]CAC9250361.1 Phage major coat protein, Gp8 [Providencia rettgeri]BBV01536.1 hypothetical protein BML2526_31880 [Providencia rettgeri]